MGKTIFLKSELDQVRYDIKKLQKAVNELDYWANNEDIPIKVIMDLFAVVEIYTTAIDNFLYINCPQPKEIDL